jgi:hypothetical protein
MAGAPKGNKNATGNKGGKSLQDRELAADVRRLTLFELKQILLQDGLTEMKKQVILKLASTVLPRLNEHTGADGTDLFPTPLLANTNVSSNNSNAAGGQSGQKDTGGTGGNVGQQDNIDSLLSDRPEPAGQPG